MDRSIRQRPSVISSAAVIKRYGILNTTVDPSTRYSDTRFPVRLSSNQACDDKICFNPQTVPLSWTVNLKPLDRERAARP